MKIGSQSEATPISWSTLYRKVITDHHSQSCHHRHYDVAHQIDSGVMIVLWSPLDLITHRHIHTSTIDITHHGIDDLQWRDTIKTSVRGSCVRLSPFQKGECMIITQDGSLHTWDLDSPLRIQTVQGPKFREKGYTEWIDCHYGSHPRSLYVSTVTGVSHIDTRVTHTSSP